MMLLITLGIPVVVILFVAFAVKLKSPYNYLLIVILAVCSTFIVDFIFCSVLKSQCEADALSAVAFVTHPALVCVITVIIYKVISEKSFLE